MNLQPVSPSTVPGLRRLYGLTAAALLTFVPLQALDQRYTYKTDRELQGFIDSNDDGLLDVILIDRTTGRYRIGIQTGGNLSWEGPYPTGISDPSGFSVASITNSGRDQLVVAGPGTNRLHLVETWKGDLLNDPLTILPSGLGPFSVAALDIGLPGNDPSRADLVVFSQYNDPPATYQRHLFLSTSSVTETGTQNSGLALEEAARVLSRVSQPPRLANFFRNPNPDSDLLIIQDAGSALLSPITSLVNLPSGARFIHGALDPGNPDAIQFILFTPGGTELLVAPVDPATESFPASPSVYPLGSGPIAGVYLARRAGTTGLVVIFNDGQEARFYTLDSSLAPQLQESLYPPFGTRFTGALGFTNNQLAMLTGTSFNSPTEGTSYFDGSTGTWTETGSASLPQAGSQSALSNIFLYDKEPVLNPDARFIRAVHAPDWTSGLSIDGSSNVDVTIEDFTGPMAGLAFSTAGLLFKEPEATFGYANQIRDDISLSSGTSLLGSLHLDIGIDPAPGTYNQFVEPRLIVSDPASISIGFQAWYRFGPDEAWQPFDVSNSAEVISPPEGGLFPFTVQYYAEDTKFGSRSAIKTASYVMKGPPDSDDDGVPDFVEIYNGLDPFGGGDSDGDGYSDFDEILAGTDASDPASFPVGRVSGVLNAFDLAVRPLMHNGDLANPVFRATWPDSHPDYDGAVFRAWSLEGKLYGTATTENEGVSGISDPVVLFSGLPVGDKDSFLVIGSTRSFPFHQVQGLQGTAPELIGMVPVPTVASEPPEFVPDPSVDLATNATAWFQLTRLYYTDIERPLVTAEIGPLETLKFLLTERIIGVFADADPLSLTGFRDPIPPQESPPAGTDSKLSQADLLALQSYQPTTGEGWSLQAIYSQVSDLIDANADFRIQQLIQLASDLFGIWVSDTNSASPNPGLYPSPFDVLRDVIQDMPVSGLGDDSLPLPGNAASPQISYAGDLALTSTEQRFVELCLSFIIASLQSRPTQGYLAEVTSSTFDQSVPILEIPSTGHELHLLTASGNPYLFSPSSDLPVGSLIQVLAFTDRFSLPEIEVISADLVSVPTPAPIDLDGNLIDDSIQTAFFSTSTPDPFADDDADGFMTFQELLEKSNPLLFSSQPTVDPITRFPPTVTVTQTGPGQLALQFSFPPEYVDQIRFGLEMGTTLGGFIPMSPSFDAQPSGGETWTSETSGPSAPGEAVFFRFRPALK